MKTDIQIAQEATMFPIKDVAASIGIKEDDLELYGKYKAKISDELINRTKKNPDGEILSNMEPNSERKSSYSKLRLSKSRQAISKASFSLFASSFCKYSEALASIQSNSDQTSDWQIFII